MRRWWWNDQNRSIESHADDYPSPTLFHSDIGIPGIITRIRDRVGQDPVYITLDIDVVDPSFGERRFFFLVFWGKKSYFFH